MSGKIYVFDTSRGDGVPGLPHEVTEEWLKANPDMEQVSKDAVATGSYKAKAEPKPKAAAKLDEKE